MRIIKYILLALLTLSFVADAQVVPGPTSGGGPTSVIVGQLQTATGGTINNGTLTFTLSQPAVVSGIASLATQQSSCYTANSGNIVGVPDPTVLPITSTNTSAGTLPAGTYYVKIYYAGAGGFSAASPEAVVSLSSQGTIYVNPPALQPSVATGFFGIGIGTTSGGEIVQIVQSAWTQYAQSVPLTSGGSPPSVNTSSCSLYFSDQLIPTGTNYSVNLVNKNGSKVAGFPQTWCTYGGAGATINVSNGAPTGNCNTNGVFYPTPILSNNASLGTQSISTPLNLTGPFNVLGTQNVTGPSTFSGSSTFNGATTLNGATTINGTPVVTSPLKINDLTVGVALTSFGDSFTAGFGLASPSTQNWAALLSAEKGWTLTNNAVSGSLCMDQADYFMPQSPTTASIFAVMFGYNDMRVNGTSVSKQYEYQRCLLAALSWLGTPASQRVFGQACTVVGTGSNTPAYGGTIGKDLTVNGSTLTCNTPPGTTVTTYATTQVSNTGSFSVTIDGISYGTFSNTGTVTDVAGTRNYAPAAYRFAGLQEKPHTVVFNAISTDGVNNTVHILGVSVSSPAVGARTGPFVYVASIPRSNSTGYAVTCSPTACNNGSDAAVGSYNYSVYQTVCDLAADGVQVVLVDVTNTQAFDPNNSPQIQADNIHPTAFGDTNIATAFINRATLTAFPGNPGCELNSSSFEGSVYVGEGIQLANQNIGELGTNTQTGSNYGQTGIVRFGSDLGGLSRNGSVYTLNGPPSGPATLLIPQTAGNTATATVTIGTGNVTTAGTAIASGTCQAQTGITVTNAATSDSAAANLGATLPATWQTGIQFRAEVTGANTVTVNLCNPTAGSITPAATQVNVRVLR